MYFHTQMHGGVGVMIKKKIKMMEIVIKATVGELIQNISPSQVKVCHILFLKFIFHTLHM